jgi:hypothetical protein
VFLRRLRSLGGLEAGERRLALRAIAWMLRCRVQLRVGGFARLRARIEGIGATGESATAEEVRRAIRRAARTLPGSSCLSQSLSAEALLRSAGLPARLTIGVAAPANGATPSLDAHAWVVSAGIVVAGEGELGRYRQLLAYGSDP